MVKETLFETILYIISFFSAVYIFLQFFIPILQNLLAQGIAGVIIIFAIIWALAQQINRNS